MGILAVQVLALQYQITYKIFAFIFWEAKQGRQKDSFNKLDVLYQNMYYNASVTNLILLYLGNDI